MLDQIQNFLNTLGGQAAMVTIVIEFALRLVKSEKPLSIAHGIAKLTRTIADFLDKVLPQNLAK